MRRTALVLLVTLGSSLAVAQSPPSVTLERAIKLYDKKDFFSSTIEAQKVIQGTTGDSPEQVQRAKFFLAKALYQIGLYVPSMGMFQRIIEERGMYRAPSWKWIAGFRGKLPDAMIAPFVVQIEPQELEDPTLSHGRAILEELSAMKPVPVDAVALARGALGCTHADVARVRELAAKLDAYEDNAEIAEATKKTLRIDTTESRTLEVAFAQAPAVTAGIEWINELHAELELLNQSDKAWQTTQVAAEVLQELTIQFSVGEADLGTREREILHAFATAELGSAPFPTLPGGCVRRAEPTIAGGASSPMVVDPPRQGCGCSTGGSPDGALLVGLLAVAFRRKNRAASGTRSPRA